MSTQQPNETADRAKAPSSWRSRVVGAGKRLRAKVTGRGPMLKAEFQTYERMVRHFMRKRQDVYGDLSGLEGYYLERLETGRTLTAYEIWFLKHLCTERRVFHAGIGIGVLTAALARCGVECVGFEFDFKRHQAALALREEAGSDLRYEIRRSKFPGGLDPSDRTSEATLLFTNVAAGWTEAQVAEAIRTMHLFRRTILDLRLFGWTRNGAADRAALQAQIEDAGHKVTPLPVTSHDAHYVEIRSLRRRTPRQQLRRVLGTVGTALDMALQRRRRPRPLTLT